MWLQALAHPVIALGARFNVWASGLSGAMLLGLGTAMVYPSLLAAVSDVAHPVWRARSLSVYRSWRDFGYAVGAAIAGFVAGALDLAWSIHVAGLLTFVSGMIAWITVRETRCAEFGRPTAELSPGAVERT
jgi:MFS family permease